MTAFVKFSDVRTANNVLKITPLVTKELFEFKAVPQDCA